MISFFQRAGWKRCASVSSVQVPWPAERTLVPRSGRRHRRGHDPRSFPAAPTHADRRPAPIGDGSDGYRPTSHRLLKHVQRNTIASIDRYAQADFPCKNTDSADQTYTVSTTVLYAPITANPTISGEIEPISILSAAPISKL
jgi:hypothetical protein